MKLFIESVLVLTILVLAITEYSRIHIHKISGPIPRILIALFSAILFFLLMS